MPHRFIFIGWFRQRKLIMRNQQSPNIDFSISIYLENNTFISKFRFLPISIFY